jgi:hypothetical protein
MKVLIICLLMSFSAMACDEVTLHTVSHHYNLPVRHIDVNNANIGLGVVCNGLVAGAYYNTFWHMSMYAGKKFGDNYGVILGGVTGYPKERYSIIEPLVVGYVSIPVGDIKINLTFSPPMSNMVGVASVSFGIPISH